MTNDPAKPEPHAFLFDPWTLVPPRNRQDGFVFSPYFPEEKEQPEPSRGDDAKPRRSKRVRAPKN